MSAHHITLHANTDEGGGKVPNQDNCTIFKSKHFDALIVCDGMGGHTDGDWASKITINILTNKLQELAADPKLQSISTLFFEKVRNIITLANETLHNRATKLNSIVGTTLTILIIARDPKDRGTFIWSAHSGDSKIYLLNNQTMKTYYISKDHNRLNQSVELGEKLDNVETLTSCIGGRQEYQLKEKLFVLTNNGDLHKKDNLKSTPILIDDKVESLLFILCSDGMTCFIENDFNELPIITKDIVDEENHRILTEIKQFIPSNTTVEQATQHLIDVAKRNETWDNVTVGMALISINSHEFVNATINT